MKSPTLLILLLLLHIFKATVDGQDAEYWNKLGKEALREALALQKFNIGPAKNIIVFVGDGMSVPTVSAARIRDGQLRGRSGEGNSLAWDTFPHVGLIKTYSTDHQVADSASTATALFSGVKTKTGVLGIDDRVTVGDCASGRGGSVSSVLTQAYRSGKATGLVSTARVTHATPAALYAHVPDRDWEADTDIPLTERGGRCVDIALQLVEHNPFIKVILGGGRRNFYDRRESDPARGREHGARGDARDLITEWGTEKHNAQYVWTKEQFEAVDEEETDYLLGLFDDDHMKYDSEAEEGDDPTLAAMTEKAVNILQKEEKGFFLMVEGGRIDHAHHGGNAYNTLGDTIAMSEAVAKAVELTSRSDTLIIVTADHAHTMGFAGYPLKGNDILGLTGEEGLDHLPYSTLGYLNGPGGVLTRDSYHTSGERRNLAEAPITDAEFIQDAIVPLTLETHGGDDVAVYALGPMSHLFHGVQEQSYIAHVVRFAGCYDDEEENICTSDDDGDDDNENLLLMRRRKSTRDPTRRKRTGNLPFRFLNRKRGISEESVSCLSQCYCLS